MRTLDIGVDLDGVCYDFAGSLRQYMTAFLGWDPATLPDPTVWGFYDKEWGITEEEFIRFCNDGVDAGVVFRAGQPRQGCIDALRFLDEMGHRLHIVTDRSFGSRSQQNTFDWLARWNVPHTTVTFSRDKTVVDVDIFIDDRPENYDALEEHGSFPFLFTQPWNLAHEGRRVGDLDFNDRVAWEEFVDVVDSIAFASESVLA